MLARKLNVELRECVKTPMHAGSEFVITYRKQAAAKKLTI